MSKINLNENAKKLLPEYLVNYILVKEFFTKTDVKRIIKYFLLKKKINILDNSIKAMKERVVERKIELRRQETSFMKTSDNWKRVSEKLKVENIWMDNLLKNAVHSVDTGDKFTTDFSKCQRCGKPKSHNMYPICNDCRFVLARPENKEERKKYVTKYYYECQICGAKKNKSRYPLCLDCGKKHKANPTPIKYYKKCIDCGKERKKPDEAMRCRECHFKFVNAGKNYKIERKRMIYICPICNKNQIASNRVMCASCRKEFEHNPIFYLKCEKCGKKMKRSVLTYCFQCRGERNDANK